MTIASGSHKPEGKAPSGAARFLSRVHAWFEDHYGLDLRSLALFRLGLGFILLYDLVTRALDLRAHYTDVGVMPRERLISGWSQSHNYSLHVFGGDVVSQTALFLVAGVFAFMLFVGYRTRLAAFMSWVFLCSLQGRNYIVLQGGDDMLRVMLFWSMFTPLGVRFSVDAVLAEHRLQRASGTPPRLHATTRRRLPKHVLSLGTTVLAMQLFTVYFVSAALKTGPTWHTDGSAIHLALHHHAFVSRIGLLFAQLPAGVLSGMTWQIWWLELCGPLLFFIPWGTFWWRCVQALLFIGFHFGLFLCMELGHFPWVAMACWLVVLPAWFWDKPLHELTVRTNLRPKLRELSKTLQGFVLRQRWLRAPFKPPGLRPSIIASLVVLCFASYTAYGSAFAMTHGGGVRGERFNPLLALRLYANWGMFAPNPPNTSGWFVIVGNQKNGLEVDVWNNVSPVSWEKPEVPSATYRAQRWRKFLDNITNERHAVVRPYFLKWVCRDWNERHEPDEQIRSATLYHLSQIATWPEPGYTEVSKKNLQRQSCPAVPIKKSK